MVVEDRRKMLGILACILAVPFLLGPLGRLLRWTGPNERDLPGPQRLPRRSLPEPPRRSVKRHG